MFTINRNPTPRDLRFFAWSMLLGFNGLSVIIIVITWLKFGTVRSLFTPVGAPGAAVVALSLLGTATGIVSLLSEAAARRLYITWMTVTVPIGVIMSTILLTVLFVFLLPLFSLVVRLGDPLRKRLGGRTYWEDYKHYEPTLERMRRPF